MWHISVLKLFLQNQLRVVKKVALLIVNCCFTVLWHGPIGRHLTFLEKRPYKTQEAAECPLGNVQRAIPCGRKPLFWQRRTTQETAKARDKTNRIKSRI